jgi:hypothetical protein
LHLFTFQSLFYLHLIYNAAAKQWHVVEQLFINPSSPVAVMEFDFRFLNLLHGGCMESSLEVYSPQSTAAQCDMSEPTMPVFW